MSNKNHRLGNEVIQLQQNIEKVKNVGKQTDKLVISLQEHRNNKQEDQDYFHSGQPDRDYFHSGQPD